ncbi:STAS domain-containing protein [Catenulispora yoronensis]|uniref:STAS domain-containing protein n=1 Tax=Catenulispora yoronensis TaxID=450799 RepID=A0ABN2TI96_9ACTN
MTALLAVTPRRRPDGVTVLTVAGEIDMSTTGILATALEQTPGPVVVDLEGVEYLDSAGLSVLFAHAERIELVANPLLEPVLAISGLTELTTVHR